MFWGLELANLIDLDHIYYRLIGKVGFFDSACSHLGIQRSLGFYPLHTLNFLLIIVLTMILSFFFLDLIDFKTKEVKEDKNKEFFLKEAFKKIKLTKKTLISFIFWISIGIIVHFGLDYLHLLIGFGI